MGGRGLGEMGRGGRKEIPVCGDDGISEGINAFGFGLEFYFGD